MRFLRLFLSFIILSFASVHVTFAQSTCSPDCGVPAGAIEAYPTPNVYPLQIDESILYDRNYHTIIESLAVYDAPNGNLLEDYGTGYNYATVIQEVGGWSEIAEGKWVKSEILSEPSLPSRFAGVELPDEPLPYTMAWTLKHLRASKSPGGESADDNPYLYRYTRVTLYATVEVDGFNWYQIGENQWVHQFNVAKILPTEKPADIDTHKWVSVDLYEQVAVAYEDDKPVFATLISSGLPQWSTNEGVFHVYLRFPRTLMSGGYDQEDFYYLQEVPWTMYFDSDIALHGTYWHDGFGFRQSHGCVNLSILDAYWIFNWAEDEFDFATEDFEGPAVYVYSSGEYN